MVDDPAILVAILIAARRSGNRVLEREARRNLRDCFGVSLRFHEADNQEREYETTHDTEGRRDHD